MKKIILAASMSLLALFMAHASADGKAPTLTMTNPAATFCIDQGGTTKTVETKEGQVGICVLKDGTEVDEWDHFHKHN